MIEIQTLHFLSVVMLPLTDLDLTVSGLWFGAWGRGSVAQLVQGAV